MSYKTVLLIGKPGAGKSTQSNILSLTFNKEYFHVSTGDMFREIKKSKENTELIEQMKEWDMKGKLYPDELTYNTLISYLNIKIEDKKYSPNHQKIILDGFPRNKNQAEMMTETFNIEKILLLTLPFYTSINRVRKRAKYQKRTEDQKIHRIIRRLFDYYIQTNPILEKYDTSIIYKIDARKTIDEVQYDIKKLLMS